MAQAQPLVVQSYFPGSVSPNVFTVSRTQAPYALQKETVVGPGRWRFDWQPVGNGIRRGELVRDEEVQTGYQAVESSTEFVRVPGPITITTDAKNNVTTIAPSWTAVGSVSNVRSTGMFIPTQDGGGARVGGTTPAAQPAAATAAATANSTTAPQPAASQQKLATNAPAPTVVVVRQAGCKYDVKLSSGKTIYTCPHDADPKHAGFCAVHATVNTTAAAPAGTAPAGQAVAAAGAKTGGAAVVAGAAPTVGGNHEIDMPQQSQAQTMPMQTKDSLIANMYGLPGNLVQGPDFAVLRNTFKEEDKNKVVVYVYDETFGVENKTSLQTGFKFLNQYLSYPFLKNEAYLGKLASVAMRLRALFPDQMHHVYDPNGDSVDSMEAEILAAIVRIERDGGVFNRQRMFSGFDSFRGQVIMHPFIAFYAFSAPTKYWMSPISFKYYKAAAVPDATNPGGFVSDPWIDDWMAVAKAMHSALQDLRDFAIVPDMRKRMISYRPGQNPVPNPLHVDVASARKMHFMRVAEFSKVNDGVIGVLEGHIMTILAKLQFAYGKYVKFDSQSAWWTKNNAASYISEDLLKYILTFAGTVNGNFLTPDGNQATRGFGPVGKSFELVNFPTAFHIKQARARGEPMPRRMPLTAQLGVNCVDPALTLINIPPRQFVQQPAVLQRIQVQPVYNAPMFATGPRLDTTDNSQLDYSSRADFMTGGRERKGGRTTSNNNTRPSNNNNSTRGRASTAASAFVARLRNRRENRDQELRSAAAVQEVRSNRSVRYGGCVPCKRGEEDSE